MGARLTFGLVAVAAATLAAGYFTHTVWLIYLSIVCSVLAAIALAVSSRRRRKRAPARVKAKSTRSVVDENPWPAVLAEPTVEEAREFRSVSVLRESETVTVGSGAARRRTTPTLAAGGAESGEPATEGLSVVNARRATVRVAPTRFDPPVPRRDREDGEPVGHAPRASIATPAVRFAPPVSRRDPSLPQPAQAAVPRLAHAAVPRLAQAAVPRPAEAAVPRPAEAAVPRPPRRLVPVPTDDDFPFPIEDYSYLGVADILPLLPELDDQELVEVLLVEQAGANRARILNRIDALLEGEEV